MPFVAWAHAHQETFSLRDWVAFYLSPGFHSHTLFGNFHAVSFSMHLICCIFLGAHPLREGAVFIFCFKICQISRMKWIWPRTQPKFRDILRHPFGSKAPNDNPFQKMCWVCMETFHLNQMSIYTQESKTYCNQNHAKLYL